MPVVAIRGAWASRCCAACWTSEIPPNSQGQDGPSPTLTPLGHLLKMIDATRSRDIDEIYSSVSAFTVFNRSHRTIVFNESHSPARHRSNMAHELAHALLMHHAERSGVGEAQELLHEKEATWLGGVLMLTADQAHQIVTCNLPDTTATHLFCVSPEMLRYRLNVTGAAKLARGRNLPATAA
ncbi:hypothetical protein DBA29_27200 [Xenophilus aerolatus]|nr:hypothetical protein [Xenophilus aerolatus]